MAAHKKHGGPEGLEKQRRTHFSVKLEERVTERKEDSREVLLSLRAIMANVSTCNATAGLCVPAYDTLTCLTSQEEQAAERVKQIKDRIKQESKKGKQVVEGGCSHTLHVTGVLMMVLEDGGCTQTWMRSAAP